MDVRIEMTEEMYERMMETTKYYAMRLRKKIKKMKWTSRRGWRKRRG